MTSTPATPAPDREAAIRAALATAQGVIADAARIAGVSRQTVYAYVRNNPAVAAAVTAARLEPDAPAAGAITVRLTVDQVARLDRARGTAARSTYLRGVIDAHLQASPF